MRDYFQILATSYTEDSLSCKLQTEARKTVLRILIKCSQSVKESHIFFFFPLNTFYFQANFKPIVRMSRRHFFSSQMLSIHPAFQSFTRKGHLLEVMCKHGHSITSQFHALEQRSFLLQWILWLWKWPSDIYPPLQNYIEHFTALQVFCALESHLFLLSSH